METRLRDSSQKLTGLFARGVLLAITLLTVNAAAAAESNIPGLKQQPFATRSGPRVGTLFKVLSPEETGVKTENRYADPAMWGERYHEFEVGSIGTGVAIGDYDGDGRPDIFVVSKTETCRLFRNLGAFKFEDVTEKAGVLDQGDAAKIWKQGAAFADVNNDGLLDIYVCRFGAPNLLYINQGDGSFREEAAARGLAVNDSSVMAAFCDYDRDGWLDVFVQTNMRDAAAHPNGQRDYLFHNNGNGTFTNVTDAAGIRGETQGHSATWWDYDNDGWPDLYVANDFAPADSLYHNNHDGTFTNTLDSAVPHTTFSSMGSDLGDVNNDGLIDLLVADMAATTHEKDQRSMANMRALSVEPADDSRAAPQYLRNALFLNTGTGRCLEAAFLAGLNASDWTWAPRFEDLDNDGRLDLFVSNGMHREAHNADLMARMTLAENPAEKIRVEKSSPVLVESNLAFRNLGDLQFENVSHAWGLDQKGVSFGAAFGDLDGDGDLDLVYGNYQAGATVLRNDSDTGHRVIVALRGAQSNRFGVGATVRIEADDHSQIRQLVLARGVLSTSEPILHFGVGDSTRIQRLTVSWPSGQTQTFSDLAVDQKLTITEPSAPVTDKGTTAPGVAGQFTDVSQAVNFSLSSRENRIDETTREPLVPMRQNRRGPALAVGDINGDGRDDVVMGGTPPDPLRLLVAGTDDRFSPTAALSPLSGDTASLNDGPLLLFDADGDGTIDLLVTKAGVSQPAGAAEYQPQLFLNKGGVLQPAAADALPALPLSVGAVSAADFDHDGRLDVFIGGRVLPGRYPAAPKSALLQNQGGRLIDVTDSLAARLREVGMVTSALWSDVDDDGWADLLLTLEWGQVKCFHNNHGAGFEDWSAKLGFAAAGTGWWTALAAADFNGDGRPDYVVGNVGLNTQYHADAEHPALLFVGDFKGSGGAPQIVEAYYDQERLVPWRNRRSLGAAIPTILKRFPRTDAYARATLSEILGNDKVAAAQRFAATELRSGVFLSQADGTYLFRPLPRLAQISPVQGLVAGDFDGDGHADIYAVQNSYSPIPTIGRFDGGLSQLLRGDGHGGFEPVPLRESNLVVPGDAKALATLDLNHDGWPDFLITRNNNTTLAYQNHGVAGRHSIEVIPRGRAGNPTAVGARLTLELADGSTQTCEVAAGSGYFSQSSAGCFFGYVDANPPRHLRVRWPLGMSTEHDLSGASATFIVSEPAP